MSGLGELEKGLLELRNKLDQMAVAWSTKKIEEYDSEKKESWIVETLNPDNFQQFYDALDSFTVAFKDFERKFGVFKADNVIVPQEETRDLEVLIARHKNIQFQIIAKNRRERDALADNQMLWNKLTDKITELLGLKQKEPTK